MTCLTANKTTPMTAYLTRSSSPAAENSRRKNRMSKPLRFTQCGKRAFPQRAESGQAGQTEQAGEQVCCGVGELARSPLTWGVVVEHEKDEPEMDEPQDRGSYREEGFR